MADQQSFDVVVIGGGPAGYVGAIRAAQLGMKVACVERDRLGGVCLNWGCIPTKTLLASAELYARMKHDAASWGIQADNLRHDWATVIGRSRNVAGNLNKGVTGLLKKNKIAHFVGTARITAAGAGASGSRVEVHKPTPGTESSWDPHASALAAKGAGLETVLNCKHIIIATGAISRTLPGVEIDGKRVLSARDAMSLPQQPKRLVIIGAGAIGVEFAYFYNAFGTQVTLIEMLDRILPIEDGEVSKALEKSFRKQGIDVRTAHKTTNVKVTDAGVEVTVAPTSNSGGAPGSEGGGAPGSGGPETIAADHVLMAIGIRGRYEGLFSDELAKKLETFKDHIKVTRPTYATNLPGVYAVGDVNGPPWLAHVASEEAVQCVERIAGHHPVELDYDSVPGCTYCEPQVASVGKTEEALKAAGMKLGTDYTVGKFPFQASGKAQAIGATEGFVKIISSVKHGELLGVHMIGEHVTELLAEACLAKRLEATSEELIATLHAHPTLSESVHEAALGTLGRMVHF